MTWAKLDDRFPQHRKVRRLSDAAFRVHVTAICACAGDLTDGYLTTEDVQDLIGVPDALEHVPELVSRGLWDEFEGGWLIHDYLEYNPSSDKIKAEKAKTAERVRKWRASRNAVTNAVGNGMGNAASNGFGNGDAANAADHAPLDEPSETPAKDEPAGQSDFGNGVTNALVTLPRTRPVPVPLKDSSSAIADAIPDQSRPDVEKICQAMNDSLTARGITPKPVSKAWRTSARLLLDRDGRTLEQVLWVINWVETDEFWSGNVESVPKLRKQFDQLVLKIKTQKKPRGPVQPTGDAVDVQAWMYR